MGVMTTRYNYRKPINLGGSIPVLLDAVTGFATALGDNDRTHTVGSGATLLLGVLSQLNPSLGGATITWDPLSALSGGNQTMSLITSFHPTDNNSDLFLFGLINPAPGSSIIRVASTVGVRTSLAAISFKNTKTVGGLSAAVPSGSFVQGRSGSAVASWGMTTTGADSLSIPANWYGFIMNQSSNGISSGVSWTGATHTDGGWANAGMNLPATYASSISLQINETGPADFCAGQGILIAPA
jgi:hypothetical protein